MALIHSDRSIEENLYDIQYAAYGPDTRAAIHDCIEQTYTGADSAASRANQAATDAGNAASSANQAAQIANNYISENQQDIYNISNLVTSIKGSDISGWSQYKNISSTSGSVGDSETFSASTTFIKIPSYAKNVTYSISSDVTFGSYIGTYTLDDKNYFIERLYVNYNNPTITLNKSVRYVRISIASLDLAKASAVSLSWETDLGTTITSLSSLASGLIDPDYYNGSDSEKLQQAINSIPTDGSGVILIKRRYTFTSNIYIPHDGEANSLISLIGVGNESIFDMGEYGFHPLDTNKSYGMISFKNILFKCTNICFDASYIIRVFFDTCVFDGGNYILRDSHFIQSYYFTNCIIRNVEKAIIQSHLEESNLLDIRFTNCLIEHCYIFITAVRLHGVYITSCCIEGFYGRPFILRGDTRNFVINSCYFEGNNNGSYNPDGYVPEYVQDGTTIDLTNTVGNIQQIIITNNRFSYKSGNIIIKLRKGQYNRGSVIIENNWVNPALPDGATLLLTSDSDTSIRRDIYYSHNDGFVSSLIAGTQKIIDSGKASISYTNELTESDTISDIEDPGYYHASDNHGIIDAPSPGEFYMMNIISDSGCIKIAFTTGGLRYKFNDENWI